MENLERIEGKVDKLDAHLLEVKVTLAKNTESLVHHIRRTDALEARVDSAPQKLLWAVSILSALVVLAKQLL